MLPVIDLKRKNYKISQVINDNWIPVYTQTTLGFKNVANLGGKYDKLEIKPILMSAGHEIKLLRRTILTSHGGMAADSVVENFTMDLLEDWNCSADGAISMVFDTTSTNTDVLD